MIKSCEHCNKEFKSRKRTRFCSRACVNAKTCKKEYARICIDCKEIKFFKENSKSQRCLACAQAYHSGNENPRWRGGHKHWSPGRYSKDKNDLSWKTQRRLAWKRDNELCQHCHEKKNRKPDVHHIIPWMNSQSHALDNLICLCQSCHLKEEARVQEKWGGQLTSRLPKIKIIKEKVIKAEKRPERKSSPCTCGETKLQALGDLGLCWLCWNPILKNEQQMGLTMKEIASKYSLNYKTVDFILHPWNKKSKERLNVRVSSLSRLEVKT